MKAELTQNENSLVKFLKKLYKDIFHDNLNATPMAGAPMHIYLKEGVIVPCRVTTARVIPRRMETPAAKAVQDLLDKKVIVPVSTPTEWCSPAFFVGKKESNKVRMVTDSTNMCKEQFTHSRQPRKLSKQYQEDQDSTPSWTQCTDTSNSP